LPWKKKNFLQIAKIAEPSITRKYYSAVVVVALLVVVARIEIIEVLSFFSATPKREKGSFAADDATTSTTSLGFCR
jgi:hypothetical protein